MAPSGGGSEAIMCLFRCRLIKEEGFLIHYSHLLSSAAVSSIVTKQQLRPNISFARWASVVPINRNTTDTRGFQDPMSQTSTISHQTTGHATYRTLPSLVRIMIRVSSAAISRRKYITLTLSGVHYNQSNNRLGSISSYSSVAKLCLQKLMSTPSRITTNLADNDSLPSSLSSYSSCN